MKIVVLCEGSSEAILKSSFREFVQSRSSGGERIGLETLKLPGTKIVSRLQRMTSLTLKREDVIGVVALIDVYPNHEDAEEAKQALYTIAKVGKSEARFRAHAALWELEAWLLPFWEEIADWLRVPAKRPGPHPEQINGQSPPSKRLKELFQRAGREYNKVADAHKWLTAARLERAAKVCPQLKAFLNSLLEFAGAKTLK